MPGALRSLAADVAAVFRELTELDPVPCELGVNLAVDVRTDAEHALRTLGAMVRARGGHLEHQRSADLFHVRVCLTTPSRPASTSLLFPPFRMDLANEVLWRGTESVSVRTTPFKVLRYLAERPQRLVRREDLIAGVWGGAATSESLVRTHIYALRRAVGPAVIETVSRRGYRFMPQVFTSA